MKLSDIINVLDTIAPREFAVESDNVGLLVQGRDEVSSALLCLDVTDKAIDKAIELGSELIIAHHPLLFNSIIKNITKDTALGRRLIRLIENGVSVFAMHTNLDAVSGGLNDWLVERLGLDIDPTATQNLKQGLGRFITLNRPMTLRNLAEKVGKALNIDGIDYFGEKEREIRRIGLCTGNGSSAISEVIGNCDVYMTGDCKYHIVLDMLANGLSYIDITHYKSEIIFADSLKQLLKTKLNIGLEVFDENFCW